MLLGDAVTLLTKRDCRTTPSSAMTCTSNPRSRTAAALYDRGTRTHKARVALRWRVPGRGPTQPIVPYRAINYCAEVSL
jgi:hypothetical protein